MAGHLVVGSNANELVGYVFFVVVDEVVIVVVVVVGRAEDAGGVCCPCVGLGVVNLDDGFCVEVVVVLSLLQVVEDGDGVVLGLGVGYEVDQVELLDFGREGQFTPGLRERVADVQLEVLFRLLEQTHHPECK